MSTVAVPLDIQETVIDILSQDDLNLVSTKACSLVSRDLLHICRKRIFAAVALNDPYVPEPRPDMFIQKATTAMFQQLIFTTPEIAGYIRILRYCITSDDLNDPGLAQNFKKLTHLQHLRFWNNFGARRISWDQSPLRPTLLHLICLPTLLSFTLFGPRDYVVANISNLKHNELENLTAPQAPSDDSSGALIDINALWVGYMDNSIFIDICAEKRADGKPIIDFTRLTEVSMEVSFLEDLISSYSLFCHCEWVTKVQIIVTETGLNLIGLSQLLSPCLQTLQSIDIQASLDEEDCYNPYCGIAEELEEMSNKNIIEHINIQINICTDLDCAQDAEWGILDQVLTESGWPKLQHVSLTIQLITHDLRDDGLAEALQKLPDTQFPGLSSRKSLSFEFNFQQEWI